MSEPLVSELIAAGVWDRATWCRLRGQRKRYARPALLTFVRGASRRKLDSTTGGRVDLYWLRVAERAERRLAAWVLDSWAIPRRTIADATGLSEGRCGQILAEARFHGDHSGRPLSYPLGRRELLDAWRAWSRGL